MLSVIIGSIKAGVCYAKTLAKDKRNKALWSYTLLSIQYCYCGRYKKKVLFIIKKKLVLVSARN